MAFGSGVFLLRRTQLCVWASLEIHGPVFRQKLSAVPADYRSLMDALHLLQDERALRLSFSERSGFRPGMGRSDSSLPIVRKYPASYLEFLCDREQCLGCSPSKALI